MVTITFFRRLSEMDIQVAQNHKSLPCVKKDTFILKEDNNKRLQGTVMFKIFVNNLKEVMASTFVSQGCCSER